MMLMLSMDGNPESDLAENFVPSKTGIDPLPSFCF